MISLEWAEAIITIILGFAIGFALVGFWVNFL